MIVPGLVKIDELNRLFHDPLCGSRFERVYLVLHIGSVVFGWARAEGWQIAADPDARVRELHRARMNDLIFNQIPNHHCRSRMTGYARRATSGQRGRLGWRCSTFRWTGSPRRTCGA
jgi:hypothetical protein